MPTSCFGYNVLVRRQSSCCHRRAGRASGELCVTTILSLPEQKLKGCLRRGINASPEGLVPPGVHPQETSPQEPSAGDELIRQGLQRRVVWGESLRMRDEICEELLQRARCCLRSDPQELLGRCPGSLLMENKRQPVNLSLFGIISEGL